MLKLLKKWFQPVYDESGIYLLALGFLITNLINQEYRDTIGSLIFDHLDEAALIPMILFPVFVIGCLYILVVSLFDFKIRPAHRVWADFIALVAQFLITASYVYYVIEQDFYYGIIFVVFSALATYLLYRQLVYSSTKTIQKSASENFDVSKYKIFLCTFIVLTTFFFYYIDIYAYDLFGSYTTSIFRWVSPVFGHEAYIWFMNVLERLHGDTSDSWAIPILATQSIWLIIESIRKVIKGERVIVN